MASSSPYRRSLLERIGIPFQCDTPAVNECQKNGETATELVLRLAEAKARSVAPRHAQSLIIGSDQIALLGDEILTKPGSHDNARKQLCKMSGQTVIFFTSLCLLNTANNKKQLDCVNYTVHFRKLSRDEAERYLTKEQAYDCAGSFKSEGYGITLLQSMCGDDPSSLIGLPLISLLKMLRREKCQVP